MHSKVFFRKDSYKVGDLLRYGWLKLTLTRYNMTSNVDDVRGYPFVTATKGVLSPGGIMQL